MSENAVATRRTPSVPATNGSSSTPLVTAQGTTTIADGVVTKIAGLAAREVSGVHALGGGTTRAISALRERIPGQSTNAAQGISVEVTEQSAAVQVEIVVEYGVAITGVAEGIRRNVISAVERMTGMAVSTVDVSVLDIYLGGEDTDSDEK